MNVGAYDDLRESEVEVAVSPMAAAAAAVAVSLSDYEPDGAVVLSLRVMDADCGSAVCSLEPLLDPAVAFLRSPGHRPALVCALPRSWDA